MYLSHAVHLALVLYHYGLSASAEASKGQTGFALAVIDTERLDYDSLLYRYVSGFAMSNPSEAAMYVFTLRDREKR